MMKSSSVAFRAGIGRGTETGTWVAVTTVEITDATSACDGAGALGTVGGGVTLPAFTEPTVRLSAVA